MESNQVREFSFKLCIISLLRMFIFVRAVLHPVRKTFIADGVFLTRMSGYFQLIQLFDLIQLIYFFCIYGLSAIGAFGIVKCL